MNDSSGQHPRAGASAPAQESVRAAAAPDAPRTSRRVSFGPLARLLPMVGRYPWHAAAALVALLLAAGVTLAIPLAVRRMIDFGFSGEAAGLINSYFGVMIGMAALLAGASAARFYLVTTLGERVVADLRAQVFRHVIGLSPVFFERTQTGEVISRLTADTTQIKSATESPAASPTVACRRSA